MLYVPYETICIVFGNGLRQPEQKPARRAGVLKGGLAVADDFSTAHRDELRSMFEDCDVLPASSLDVQHNLEGA